MEAPINFKDVEKHLTKAFGATITIKGIKLLGETRLRQGEELEQMKKGYTNGHTE